MDLLLCVKKKNELNGYNGIGDFNLVDPQKKVSELKFNTIKDFVFSGLQIINPNILNLNEKNFLCVRFFFQIHIRSMELKIKMIGIILVHQSTLIQSIKNKFMNFVIYDFETTGTSARFDQILQAGFIVYDQNFKEINRLNIKSRLNPDIIPSIHALRVNRLNMSQVLSEENTLYKMALKIKNFLSSFEKCFYIGFNSINFDEEFLRQLFWEHFFIHT